MAAVYLDGGLDTAVKVVDGLFSQIIPEAGEMVASEDYKSRLQELVQLRFKTVPQYRVVRESGPDHDKTFEACLTVGNFLKACGMGKSKKAAEQAAARQALDNFEKQAK